MNDLQKVTDQLASSLNRAVYVETPAFRPLATSAQLGPIDDARVQALLTRGPKREHARYFNECGVATARKPLRIPANAEQGLLPRLVVPITSGREVLARIWLFDADPPVDEAEITRALQAGDDMRTDLLGSREVVRHNITAGSELLRDVQHAGAGRRQTLLRKLSDGYAIGPLEQTYVCVITYLTQPAERAETGTEAGDPPLPDGVLDTLIELLDVRGAVGHIRGADLIALVSTYETARDMSASIAEAVHQTAALHDLAVNAIGIGGALATTDGFDRSLCQAEYAAKIASRISEFRGHACWDALGEFRIFYAVEWNLAGVDSIDAGVADLVAERRTPLAATLLAYLEREGDVTATATALSVHRTTLYYRLERAKKILEEEPAGQARFRIHAALRLADLAGLCTPTHRD